MRAISNRLLLLLVLLHSKYVSAATIDVDTVLGPDHPYPGETIVVVDGLSPPTEVTLLDGAIIGGIPGQSAVPIGIDAYGSSVVEMLGGIVVAMQHPALLHDEAVFRMRGGDIGLIETRDMSRAILDDGEWGGVFAYDSSRAHVNGGNRNSIFSVRTFGQAHAAIRPTSFLHLDFYADDSSTMVLTGGSFEAAEVMDNSRVLVNGGTFVTGIRVSENATLDVRYIKSIVGEWIHITDSAVVNIYGTDLRFDVIEGDQPIVVGKWPNGESLGVRYYRFDQGQIILHEVPEPSTITLALLTFGVFAATGWKNHRAMRTVAGPSGVAAAATEARRV